MKKYMFVKDVWGTPRTLMDLPRWFVGRLNKKAMQNTAPKTFVYPPRWILEHPNKVNKLSNKRPPPPKSQTKLTHWSPQGMTIEY